jgi:hypothetical protein
VSVISKPGNAKYRKEYDRIFKNEIDTKVRMFKCTACYSKCELKTTMHPLIPIKICPVPEQNKEDTLFAEWEEIGE